MSDKPSQPPEDSGEPNPQSSPAPPREPVFGDTPGAALVLTAVLTGPGLVAMALGGAWQEFLFAEGPVSALGGFAPSQSWILYPFVPLGVFGQAIYAVFTLAAGSFLARRLGRTPVGAASLFVFAGLVGLATAAMMQLIAPVLRPVLGTGVFFGAGPIAFGLLGALAGDALLSARRGATGSGLSPAVFLPLAFMNLAGAAFEPSFLPFAIANMVGAAAGLVLWPVALILAGRAGQAPQGGRR